MTLAQNAEASVRIIKDRAEILFENVDKTVFNTDEQPNEYISCRISKEFNQQLPLYLQNKIDSKVKVKEDTEGARDGIELITDTTLEDQLIIRPRSTSSETENQQLTPYLHNSNDQNVSRSLVKLQQNRDAFIPEKPEWHAPWKLHRVIAGHQGWVRAVAVEPENKWFATGSSDNTIKVWDLASGQLKLTLTGHVMPVRDIALSERHPYMFSCGEDKSVKCWDLEKNKVIRDYYGHLSAVYSLDVHPTLDVLVTGGRDSTVRVWDIRTSTGIFTLSGHKNPITKIKCQSTDPQIISTSNDKTIRLWDLAAGKTQTVLTHHKKSIRALTLHPTEYTFATASPDNIKQWKLPEGSFMHNFVPPHEAIVNTLSVNQDSVLFSGGDNGSMGFFDWKTGHKFQDLHTTRLPGSLDSEAGILSSAFDKTGLRLITGESDKGIKIWKEDSEATPESHPGIPFDPEHYRQRY